jgi:hypothetical protein
MHDCPNCGQACDCDGEDTWLNAPPDCTCCDGMDYEDDDDYYPDDGREDNDSDWTDDPCSACGPHCPEWGGDGLCMLQIRAQAEENAFYDREQHWYWRAWWRIEAAYHGAVSWWKSRNVKWDGETDDEELPF